jgi:hypothetical protein
VPNSTPADSRARQARPFSPEPADVVARSFREYGDQDVRISGFADFHILILFFALGFRSAHAEPLR